MENAPINFMLWFYNGFLYLERNLYLEKYHQSFFSRSSRNKIGKCVEIFSTFRWWLENKEKGKEKYMKIIFLWMFGKLNYP